MHWYCYLSGFWSGAFFANTVPHFIRGIAGDRFPSPFSKPPGKGLSSPTVNVAWSLFNALIAFLLWKAARITAGDYPSLTAWFAGLALTSLWMSQHFSAKFKD